MRIGADRRIFGQTLAARKAMTKIIPATASQLFDVPIFNGQVPAEGPKALGVDIPFTVDDTEFQLNLLLTQSQQFMAGVQAVFVDNSSNGDQVEIHTQTLSQPLKVPAHSQAYLPILVAKNDVLTVKSNGAVNVGLIFVNVPLPAAVWSSLT